VLHCPVRLIAKPSRPLRHSFSAASYFSPVQVEPPAGFEALQERASLIAEALEGCEYAEAAALISRDA
jgi:hypothetical protein